MATDPGQEEIAGRRSGSSTPQIAVIGGSNAPSDVLREAETVGRELALAGANLVCGGLGGVMEAACRGAHEAGGFTIGILPGDDRREANRWVKCAIPTGLGHFRNFLVVRAADGVIALPGASGTLSEAAMARTLGKPVVAVLSSRWWNPGERRERRGARLTRRVREEYRVYFDRNATMSGAKRRGSAGMHRRSNAGWVSPQAVKPATGWSVPGAMAAGSAAEAIRLVLDAARASHTTGEDPGEP